MPTYTVKRRVDAYVDYVALVSASHPKEAAEIAAQRDADIDWKPDGSCEFEARIFIALDENGFEIEETEVRDF
ncbi:MAG: hypothetical protein GC203_06080 [Phenylobacterium sp.]|uniref:hypothetical protein n=1 Tax=Phenylobacterium sp. TaxID=1871053 RepID=UPI0025E95BA5|nr:hypothetical protein [Phenylobacterium sp.]MBI1197413.1 hypothetical protein [Phenylobacterium sp.]